MADEAVLRIILDDVAGAATANRPAPTPTTDPNQSSKAAGSTTGGASASSAGTPPPSKTNPLPVTVLDAPPPKPLPAAPPAPPPIAQLMDEVEAFYSQPDPMGDISDLSPRTQERLRHEDSASAPPVVPTVVQPSQQTAPPTVIQPSQQTAPPTLDPQASPSFMAQHRDYRLRQEERQRQIEEKEKANPEPGSPGAKTIERLRREMQEDAEALLSVIKDAHKAEIEVEDEKKRMLDLEAKAYLKTVQDQKALEGATPPLIDEAKQIIKERKQKEVLEEEIQKQLAAAGEYKRAEPPGLGPEPVIHTTKFEDEYKKTLPEEPERKAGVLDFAQAIRGSLGGIIGGPAGAAVGVGLDAAAAIRGKGHGDEAMSGVMKFGLAASAVTGAVFAFNAATSEVNRMAERYADYNPAIAQAQAMAEIKGIMGDMRRAQESGPEMVKFIQEQTEMQQRFEDLKQKIWMKIIPILTGIMKAVGGILGIAEEKKDKQFDFQDPTEIILNPIKVAEVRQGATIPLSNPRDIIE